MVTNTSYIYIYEIKHQVFFSGRWFTNIWENFYTKAGISCLPSFIFKLSLSKNYELGKRRKQIQKGSREVYKSSNVDQNLDSWIQSKQYLKMSYYLIKKKKKRKRIEQ